MQRAHDAYERGIIPIDEYDANLARIRQETAKDHMEKDRLLSLSSLTAQKASAIEKLVASFKDFDTIWNAMELDEQKLILRSIIKEIRAGDGRTEIDFIF